MSNLLEFYKWLWVLFVCFSTDALRSCSKQFFSHVRIISGLPGLNQYLKQWIECTTLAQPAVRIRFLVREVAGSNNW